MNRCNQRNSSFDRKHGRPSFPRWKWNGKSWFQISTTDEKKAFTSGIAADVTAVIYGKVNIAFWSKKEPT